MLKCDEYSEPSERSVPLALCASTPSIQDSMDSIFGGDPDCYPEPKNHDRRAVYVKKDGEIVGRVPHKCSLFYCTAAVSSCSHHVFALVSVFASPLMNIINVLKCSIF